MYLVFDIGGSSVKYALMEADGSFIEKGKIKTVTEVELGVPAFVESLGEVYDRYKNRNIEGIAMGIPGQVDVEQGIVYIGGGIKYMDNVRLTELVSVRCDNIRVSIENDGKCAALAEVWLGNAKECDNVCVIICGTGIGGGIVKDRHIHRGNRFIAGEVSYLIDGMTREDLQGITNLDKITDLDEVYDSFPYLYTSEASTRSLVHHVAKRKGLPVSEVTGELIYKWQSEGDPISSECLENMYFAIAKMCFNLYATFDPDIILIGGGISAEPRFIKGIMNYVGQLRNIATLFDKVKVDTCKFLNDSNLIGALYNFFEVYGR